VIDVQEITKFHRGDPVLEDVSVSIDKGEYLGILGPGGAGKSLLLKIIAGLVEPDAGRVVIDGREVHALSTTELADLRFDIGMLFQNYALFDFMTVADNIAFPLHQAGERSDDEIEREVDDMLRRIGLPDAGDQYPRELSGGMKKRVSFARAVIRNPPILMYDDPTAGLDPVTSAKIFNLLVELREDYGTTGLTVSHDLEGLQAISDRFLMLHRGRVRYLGPVDQIADHDDRIVRQFWHGYTEDRLSAADDSQTTPPHDGHLSDDDSAAHP
jgi:phospholipid/cholesterol/gamma-HCH transport system ATP-binding protein